LASAAGECQIACLLRSHRDNRLRALGGQKLAEKLRCLRGVLLRKEVPP
jgi:hypothetical protein